MLHHGRARARSGALAPRAGSAATTAPAPEPAPAPRAGDPRRTRGLFVDPQMKARTEGGPAYQRIARRAQALWITDFYPAATVQDDGRAACDSAKGERKRAPAQTSIAMTGTGDELER